MNSIVTYGQSDLAHPVLRATQTGGRPAFLANYRLRQIVSDVAMLVAVLSFVLGFVALRMTLFAPPEMVEQIAIPVAAGAGVVFLLCLAGSLALRYGDAPQTSRAT